MKLKRNTSGFTLVEIMIVVAIIGLLAAIAVPNFVQARNNARQSVCINNLRQVDSAKEQWALASNASTGATVVAANIDPYLKNSFASTICPAGSGAYTISVISTDPACPNVVAQPGHVL